MDRNRIRTLIRQTLNEASKTVPNIVERNSDVQKIKIGEILNEKLLLLIEKKENEILKKLELKVKKLVGSSTEFYIGKTGDTPQKRFKTEPKYKNFTEVLPVISMDDNELIDRLEVKLIKSFSKNLKYKGQIQNDDDVIRSKMTDKNGKYSLYVVVKAA